MEMQLVDGVSTIIREIEEYHLQQKDVALTYALLIMKRNDREVTEEDWGKINRSIQKRWPSKSGLTRVKEMAWKIVDSKIPTNKA